MIVKRVLLLLGVTGLLLGAVVVVASAASGPGPIKLIEVDSKTIGLRGYTPSSRATKAG